MAGVTVGLVALPLAMAFAIASGLPPQTGLYCGAIAGFTISALGGSRVQIGGPTGAFVVVVSGIVGDLRPRRAVHVHLDGRRDADPARHHRARHRGEVHSAAGRDRLHQRHRDPDREHADPRSVRPADPAAAGRLSRPRCASWGPRPGPRPAPPRCWRSARSRSFSDAAGVSRRIPGSIIALLAGSAIVAAIGLPVDTIGSRFGVVPGGLPELRIPAFKPELVLTLLSPALTVAMLGAIESLLSAVVADRMSGDQARSERRADRARTSPTSCRRCSAAFRRRARSPARRPTSAPARARRSPA